MRLTCGRSRLHRRLLRRQGWRRPAATLPSWSVPPARKSCARQGLTIISPQMAISSLHPQVVTAGTIAAPYDVVLLAVKSFQLDAALSGYGAGDRLRKTMILPVLNGMRHMEILAERFTPHNVLGLRPEDRDDAGCRWPDHPAQSR